MNDDSPTAPRADVGAPGGEHRGFCVEVPGSRDDVEGLAALNAQLASWGLLPRVRHRVEPTRAGRRHHFHLDLEGAPPQHRVDLDTSALAHALTATPGSGSHAVEAEIWLAWLVSPVELSFPSFAELQAQFRVRCDIADVASRTLVDFHATAVNRPVSHWTYIEDVGFRLNAGKSLEEGLALALHPRTPESRYAFSCYRASEYVVLLALAREARRSNPALYEAMERQWLQRPLTAHAFEAAFLTELGSADRPIPKRWHVPGDRVWFRNPEPLSADVAGYEGSYVLYLGHGRFGNFWKVDRPFTVDAKLLEIYCWRYAIEASEGADPSINDDVVDAAVAALEDKPEEVARILAELDRYRDPYPHHAGGGAIDYVREVPRFVLPESATVRLP